jgi:hypothetical protein
MWASQRASKASRNRAAVCLVQKVRPSIASATRACVMQCHRRIPTFRQMSAVRGWMVWFWSSPHRCCWQLASSLQSWHIPMGYHLRHDRVVRFVSLFIRGSANRHNANRLVRSRRDRPGLIWAFLRAQPQLPLGWCLCPNPRRL